LRCGCLLEFSDVRQPIGGQNFKSCKLLISGQELGRAIAGPGGSEGETKASRLESVMCPGMSSHRHWRHLFDDAVAHAPGCPETDLTTSIKRELNPKTAYIPENKIHVQCETLIALMQRVIKDFL